jgi:ligand-binding sensor domain-containing protein/two-component sensor histidine kinase
MPTSLLRFIIFLIALLPSFVYSQQRQYVFTRISTRDGLASNYVYSIMQDSRGFMWFGTSNGLQRYDGKKIITFRSTETSGDYLPAVAISQMFEDGSKNIWLRCGKEVGIFNPATLRYKRAVIEVDEEVSKRADYTLWKDNRGKVFLILKNYGFLSYDSAQHKFSAALNQFEIPKGWKLRTMVDDDKRNSYWIACDSGLAMFNRNSSQLHYYANNPQKIQLLNKSANTRHLTTFFIDRNSRAWYATWPGQSAGESFHCYDLLKQQPLATTNGIAEATQRYHELHGFFEQKNGKLWAHGLMLFLERDTIENRFRYLRNEFPDDYGIRYDVVHTMYEDRESNVWIGTDQGVYVFNPVAQPFNSITLNAIDDNKGPGDRSITCFLESGSEIYVGSWGGGVKVFNNNLVETPPRRPFVKPGDDNYQMVWCMHKQKSNGRIWIGCQSGRLMVYDPSTGATDYYNPPILEGRTIRQIAEDRDGNIWIATQSGKLVKWQKARATNRFADGFTAATTLNSIIYKMLVDAEGFLWIATHVYGVLKLDPATSVVLARYDTKQGDGKSLNSDVVSDLLELDSKRIMIAADAINILDKTTGEIEQITMSNGLLAHNVSSLARDRDGGVWLGTLTGLSRFNLSKHMFTYFSQRDGVLNSDFQSGSTIVLRDGRMMFGTSKDFVYFDPRQISYSQAPPNVSITDFKLFNTYLPPDSITALDKVRLRFTQNSITVEFAALSFLQKDKITYYYKLDGVDDEWIRTDRALQANYTLLPPGTYSFQVFCRNGDGVASEKITTLGIEILPPFWRTWWFLLVIALGVAGLIYLAHRVRVNRLIEMEKVRRRIARDLHDDMGSTLSTINILSEMAKMKVTSDSKKTGEYLNKISDNSSRMMEAMDDIVWSINPTNDSMQKITARMREFATGVLEAKNIDFTFRVDEKVNELKLDMEERRDFFLLFKEAVNNLAKYSECRHASIDVSILKSGLNMKIQDDGIGFDPDQADSGNGMSNMKKRASSLSGELLVDSAPGKGTTVLLQMPLK